MVFLKYQNNVIISTWIYCIHITCLFLATDSDSNLCIKYRIKKPKPEKTDKVQSEKKEKLDSLSKDDVSYIPTV